MPQTRREPSPANPSGTIEIRPRADGFGAAVTGVDPDALDAAAVGTVLEAFAAHAVLWFPDQALDPARLAALAGRLGTFGEDPFVEPMDDHPHVIEVRREARETAPIFGSLWHSDWSFQAEPPSATLLYGREVPPAGGDTVFADACRAFDALSPVMQDVLSGLRAVHSATRAYGPRGLFAEDDDTRSMRIIVSDEADATCTHPLVIRHPASGRRALFVNHVYTLGIEGMREDESKALLEFLFRHMTRPQFLYRHRWRPGTLLMWDNRRVVHMADGGYEGHRRIMYRSTLAGEAPLPAVPASGDPVSATA